MLAQGKPKGGMPVRVWEGGPCSETQPVPAGGSNSRWEWSPPVGTLPLTQDSGFEELKKLWERIVEKSGKSSW